MRPRRVAPIPPEAWDRFIAALERGPTPRQVEAVKRAMDLTRNMARPGDPDYDEPETQRAIAEARRNTQPITNLRPIDPRALQELTEKMRARRGANRPRGEKCEE